MIDPVSVSAIIISSLTALSSCLVALHIRKLKSACLEATCFETAEQKLNRQKSLTPPRTPPETPILKEPKPVAVNITSIV